MTMVFAKNYTLPEMPLNKYMTFVDVVGVRAASLLEANDDDDKVEGTVE